VGRKLYVGNLPDSATEQDLSDKFAAYGTVKSVKLITERDTGRNKGNDATFSGRTRRQG